MFWYRLHERLTIPLQMNLKIWCNRPVQSFRAARRPNPEGLSFKCRASDWIRHTQLRIHSNLNSIFLCRVEQPSVFTTTFVLTRPRHCEHLGALCIIRYNYLCLIYHSRFVDLTLANTREDGSTIHQRKVQNFTPSIFSIPRLLPTSSEIYSAFIAAFFAVWSLKYFLLYCMHCSVSHRAGYFLACIVSIGFWTEVPRASIFKHSSCQEPRHSWKIFSQLHAVCALPPYPRSIHSTTSADCTVCSHAVAFTLRSIHAASFKPLHRLSCTHTRLKKSGIFHGTKEKSL